MKNFLNRFKSLPIKSQRTLGIGLVLALVVALPLFIWAVVTQNFNPENKASGITPTPIVISDAFTGTGALDSTIWGASYSAGANVVLENDQLKIYIPEGSVATPSSAITFPYVNSLVPTIIGPFDVSVDVASINSASGSAGLKFGAYTVGIFRVKRGTTETIETWKGTLATGKLDNKVSSFDLPEGTGSARLRIMRTDTGIQTFYDMGGGYVQSADITDAPQLLEDGAVPTLVAENLGPGYPATTAFFDNYNASVSIMIGPTATPTATPTASATPTETPSPTGTPNYCNGTCGSNNNCQANYYCYNGYCRKPDCPNDSTCNCTTTTPTVTPIPTIRATVIPVTTIKTTPPTPKPTTPLVSPKAFGSTYENATPTAVAEPSTGSAGYNFKYLAIGIFAVIALGFGLSVLLSSLKGGSNIYEIKTPEDPFKPESPPFPTV